MATVNIPPSSFPTFDLMLLETLKEKAEFEEPSSQRRDTSDLAGQPVAISLVGKVVVKECFDGVDRPCLSVCWLRFVRGSLFLVVVVVRRGMMKLKKKTNENFGKFKSKTIKVSTLYPVALHGRTAWESYSASTERVVL